MQCTVKPQGRERKRAHVSSSSVGRKGEAERVCAAAVMATDQDLRLCEVESGEERMA